MFEQISCDEPDDGTDTVTDCEERDVKLWESVARVTGDQVQVAQVTPGHKIQATRVTPDRQEYRAHEADIKVLALIF